MLKYFQKVIIKKFIFCWHLVSHYEESRIRIRKSVIRIRTVPKVTDPQH
jgi:hypothetical protein